MDKYSKHFLLNVDTAKEYAVEKVGYFKEDEKLEAIEIGDGNINYVFKVWNPETGKSLIIKQADTVLRSSGRPLDMHRNKIEAEILGIEENYQKDLFRKFTSMMRICMHYLWKIFPLIRTFVQKWQQVRFSRNLQMILQLLWQIRCFQQQI